MKTLATEANEANLMATEVEQLRTTERRRLRALVEADIDTARELHADDFRLINPSGVSLSKEEYLSGIASGQIDYLVWKPISPIEVRQSGQLAVIRYRAELEITVGGQKFPLRHFWHIDAYENGDGRWQVCWSQATEIQ